MANTVEIDDWTKGVLLSAKFDGNSLILTQTLDRQEYLKINKIIKGLGGSWNKKQKRHVFSDDAEAIVTSAIGEGSFKKAPDEKKEFSFWPTPNEVSDKLCQLAGIGSGDRVLEPSAGEGHLVQRVLGHTPNVTAIEISTERYLKLRQLNLDHLLISDFLLVTPGCVEEHNAVVMNPPFNVPWRKNCWIEHVQHAKHFAPIVVSVVPASIRFNSDRRHKKFHDWLNGFDFEIVDLEDRSFNESKTNVNCSILAIRG